MGRLDTDSTALHHIHYRNNQKKFFCHFTGFLEGILSSGAIEDGEVLPLIEECKAFIDRVADGDATDIIADFEAELAGYHYLADLAAYRGGMIDQKCDKSGLNRFLGFCRGVVCDGVITTKEAEHIVDTLHQHPQLSSIAGLSQIYTTCLDALEDGIVTSEESAEICSAIEAVVGDSYADTGLSQINGVANFEEYRLSNLQDEFEGAIVVLTGTFKTKPRRIFEEQLAEMGARTNKQISGRTDFLVIGGEASPHWIEMNRGRKLRDAQDLRQKGTGPRLISEGQILRRMVE